VKRLIVGGAIGTLIAGIAQAQPQPQSDPYGYNQSGADVGQAPPAAYYGPANVQAGPSPVYVQGRSGYGRQAWPGETSPGADTSVRLRSFVDPTTGVTAPPNPNNMSDQVPSRGPDVDGVPPWAPY
jgi:hypothetical protein